MIDKSAHSFEHTKGDPKSDIWTQRYNQLDKNPAAQSQEFKDFTQGVLEHQNSMAVADGFKKLEDKRISDRNNLASSYFGGDPTVRRAQASLVQAGYDLGNYGVNGVDGQFGPKTSKAVADYQKSVGLEPTGKLDQETMKSLDLTTEAGLKKTDIERMGKKGEPDKGLKQAPYMDEANKLAEKFGDTSKAIRFGIEHNVSKEAVGHLINDYNKEHKTSFTYEQWKEQAKLHPVGEIKKDNTFNKTLYNNSKLYKHEADLINKTNSIDPHFKKSIDNFQKIYEKNIEIYQEISKRTGIPSELVAALHYRESGCNFNTYFHNGDPLGKPTTHVPLGKNFNNFTDAAVDALLDKQTVRDKFGLSSNSDDKAAMMAFAESYNGLGYYNKNNPSPYVFSGTNVYEKGKYVADGEYDPNFIDKQPGVYILINELKK